MDGARRATPLKAGTRFSSLIMPVLFKFDDGVTPAPGAGERLLAELPHLSRPLAVDAYEDVAHPHRSQDLEQDEEERIRVDDCHARSRSGRINYDFVAHGRGKSSPKRAEVHARADSNWQGRAPFKEAALARASISSRIHARSTSRHIWPCWSPFLVDFASGPRSRYFGECRTKNMR